MKIRLLSDLHLEFHQDGGNCFIEGQNDNLYDVLVLAGDITTAKKLSNTLKKFRAVAKNRPIIYVPGNHEYYHSDKRSIEAIIQECQSEDSLLHCLNNSSVKIDGITFHGSTLWFTHSGKYEAGDDDLNDFHLIDQFRFWIKEQAELSAKYLRDNVSQGDVVVTHHLPHKRSINSRFEGSSLNKYFLHDVSDIVESGKAKLWLHGHTHCSCDYTVGSTRVLCNPFGYLRYEENSKFQEKLTINI